MADIEAVADTEAQYHKIGGWLILVGIGLVLTPLLMLFTILNDVIPAFSPEVWAVLTTPGSAFYSPLLGPLIVLELIADILIGLAAIILLVYFFRKAAVFPKLYIGFLVAQIAWSIIDFGLATFLLGLPQEEGSSFLVAVIPELLWTGVWVRYFLVEERVKGTFVK